MRSLGSSVKWREKRKMSEKSIWKAISFLKRAAEQPKTLPNVVVLPGSPGDQPRQARHTQPRVCTAAVGAHATARPVCTHTIHMRAHRNAVLHPQGSSLTGPQNRR